MFTGTENHDISLPDAADLTKNYRNSQTSPTTCVKGEYFSKAALTDLLNQSQCVGARIYFAASDDGTHRLVIVGVRSDESDIYTGKILEMGLQRPCPVNNSLNS